MFRATSLFYSFARNKRMIAGNWKSNKTQSEAIDFVKNTINTLKYNPDNVGKNIYTQMSSSRPSLFTSLRSLPLIPAINYLTEWRLKMLLTTVMVHTPDRSVPSILKTWGWNGSFWATLNAGHSLAKRMISSSPRPSLPLSPDSRSSTASGKPLKVTMFWCRKKDQ